MMLLSSAAPLTQRPPSLQLGGTAGDQGVPEALLCQGITSRVTAMCLSLLTGWVMPRCPQLERQRVVQELCHVLAYALQKSKRAEIRKGKSSLVAADQFLLTPIYPFWKKTCSKIPIVSIPLSFFPFWLGAEPHLVPLPSFHSKLSCITVMAKEDPCVGKIPGGGNGQLLLWAQPRNHGAKFPHTWWKSLHLYSPCNSLLSSPQNSTDEKNKWGGGRRSEKHYCVPREGKRWTALFSLSSFADVNHFSHFKQERHHFSPPVPLFIMLCISHELSLMQNLYIVRGHPNIFNDLKQSDWH